MFKNFLTKLFERHYEKALREAAEKEIGYCPNPPAYVRMWYALKVSGWEQKYPSLPPNHTVKKVGKPQLIRTEKSKVS